MPFEELILVLDVLPAVDVATADHVGVGVGSEVQDSSFSSSDVHIHGAVAEVPDVFEDGVFVDGQPDSQMPWLLSARRPAEPSAPGVFTRQ